jgi:hypothetical protein
MTRCLLGRQRPDEDLVGVAAVLGWVAREFPLISFERYANNPDGLVRARTLMLPPQTDGRPRRRRAGWRR